MSYPDEEVPVSGPAPTYPVDAGGAAEPDSDAFDEDVVDDVNEL